MSKEKLTIESVQSFEDACKVLGINAVIPDFGLVPEKHQNALLAHYKLCIIAEAINYIDNNDQIWSPDWDNGKWDKYYPWFDMSSSSGGFSFYGCDYWDSVSNVGSRLCFKTSKGARYAGQKFEELYKAYFVL